MSPRRRRGCVESTDDWEQLELLCAWPEQVRYEEIRPMVLFGVSAVERSWQTGSASERTLYRRTERFDEEGMESLFSSEAAKRRALHRWIRKMVAELKGEHHALNSNEISNIVYVPTGRKTDRKTVKRVLSEEPIPLRMVRRFASYHGIPEPRERRLAVVGLHSEGWTVKVIAGYLKVNRDTAYKTLKRWIEEGEGGLEDRSRGRPKGVCKVDLRAMNEVRKLQENPGLGAFRVRAALKQVGIHLSSATCGRILARNRRVYGLEKPKGGGGPKKPAPFASAGRHEYEMLGWLTEMRFHPKDLERVFFSTRFSGVLDASGYATFMSWKLYCAEELAGEVAALWLQEKALMLEHQGPALSRYDVEYHAGTEKLREVARHRLFETPHLPAQPKLFALEDALGDGWLKALKLAEYATRKKRRPEALQQVLFASTEVV